VEADDMNLVGALGTHYHPDHVGGKMMGWNIEGISSLLELNNIPIHIQKAETEWVTKTTGVSASHLTLHEGGDVINVGEIEITLLHTPGHTPGSQCFLVDGNLVSGDTLFLEGCGRTDLPGSNPDDMYDSLSMLASLPTDTIVYPGHRYSDPAFLALGQVRETNYVFKPTSKEGWLQWFGQ
jgi:glyoxylase-like metal-dependent hydrolase (beta-lactamase superfamily II)